MDYNNLRPDQELNENGLVFDLGSLYEYFTKIEDPRDSRGKQYALPILLTLMMLAKLGGEDSPSGISDWVMLRKELLLELHVLGRAKTPCHMTYRRVLQDIVSAAELEILVARYHHQRLQEEQEIVISLDGKTVRGTIQQGETQGVHLLAVYVPRQGLVLVQAEVKRKENEIVVAPQVLRQVNLSGVIVIGDAMHTQREISTQIVQDGGDYVWFAKDNQPRTRWAIEKLFVHEVCNLQRGCTLSKDFQMCTKVNKNHGRIEQRTIMVSSLLNDYLDWPHVAQVFRVERMVWHCQYGGKTRELVYGLTSLPPSRSNPAKLLSLIREYWGIENGLHYRRDVTLHEDATRLTVGQAGHTMAILNNLVIGLCVSQGFHNLAHARRRFCAHPHEALPLILERLC
jgi:predicted transposase YbfD/YdcC